MIAFDGMFDYFIKWKKVNFICFTKTNNIYCTLQRQFANMSWGHKDALKYRLFIQKPTKDFRRLPSKQSIAPILIIITWPIKY